MGIEFFQSMMGRKFYEADVPRIVKALEQIAEALTKEPTKTEPTYPYAIDQKPKTKKATATNLKRPLTSREYATKEADKVFKEDIINDMTNDVDEGQYDL